GSVAHQAADFRKLANVVDGGNGMPRCQRGKLNAPAIEERIGADHERTGSLAHQRRKGSLDLAAIARLDDVDLNPACGSGGCHICAYGLGVRVIWIDE